MRNYLLIISLVFIFSCGGEKNEEEFGREVFQTFIDNNPGSFKRLYVTMADMRNIINDADIPADMKSNARKNIQAKAAFWRTISKIEFNHIRFRAYEEGVNWQDTEIISVTSEHAAFDLLGWHHYDKNYGIEVKDIHVEFISNKDTFILHLDDCVKTRLGWKMTEDVRIRRKNW